MKLIANMIGYNEADRFLYDVLDHLIPLVDDVVFTDDASTDATPDIVKGMKKTHYYDNGEQGPLFPTNEGAIRSKSWENLSNHAEEGDWVLAIDCDEKLWTYSEDISLKSFLGTVEFRVVNIQFFHMWNSREFRIDKLWRPHPSTRLFRFYEHGHFLDRKLACGSEPTYVTDFVRRKNVLRASPLMMQHLGYVRDEDKRAKYDRYMKIDQGNFHNLKHIESIIDPEPTLLKWAGVKLHP